MQESPTNIISLSEFRKPEHGHSVIKAPGEEACFHLYNSAVVDNSGNHSVAIALSEVAQAAVLAWEPISPHLPSACMKGAILDIKVIAVCVLFLDVEEEARDSFYDDLQYAVGRVPTGDMLIVAKPGPLNMAIHTHPGKAWSGSEVC